MKIHKKGKVSQGGYKIKQTSVCCLLQSPSDSFTYVCTYNLIMFIHINSAQNLFFKNYKKTSSVLLVMKKLKKKKTKTTHHINLHVFRYIR